jgi:hypothetical protein
MVFKKYSKQKNLCECVLTVYSRNVFTSIYFSEQENNKKLERFLFHLFISFLFLSYVLHLTLHSCHQLLRNLHVVATAYFTPLLLPPNTLYHHNLLIPCISIARDLLPLPLLQVCNLAPFTKIAATVRILNKGEFVRI